MDGCEGQAFKEHECIGGWHLHEAIFSKKDFMKVKSKDRDYFELDERNCAVLCGVFHAEHGHTRAFKEHWREYANKYGDIIDYINGAKKYLKILV